MDAAMMTCKEVRHTSHVTRHTLHVTRHALHVTRHALHVTRHTSHVTRHTSHATRVTLTILQVTHAGHDLPKNNTLFSNKQNRNMVAVCSLKVLSSSDAFAAHSSCSSSRIGMVKGTYAMISELISSTQKCTAPADHPRQRST